ncbi:outer envelope pore protein 24A, chloroplastic-like [Durio zibethinus]|uniref:Outer envelope pore protein 24A, chloroplastic-like n=1 Tax=Durio zibethinus TaxID=66656 RepID=A0A6P5ZH92_DURZI|nr:outer envelope pore protein 24A, chloroplastic-like [Durio zibethinus]
MNASLKGRYINDKSNAATTLAINGGDVKLLSSMTDSTFVNGPSLNGLTVAVKKPGFYIIGHDVPKKDLRFQFNNIVRFAKNASKLTYNRGRRDKRTVVDGALVFDPANKVSATYMLGSRNCKLKYSYVLGGVTTLEPCYDLGKNRWDFAISRRVYDNVFKATYQTWCRNLALEWLRNTKFNGTFKISASINLAEESKNPKFIAESTWDLEV